VNILNGLNEKQHKAASHCDGPLLLLAGAGSGKTRALTHRIAYLVMEKNISPYNILSITFTNKAAREMKERVEKLLGMSTDGLWISTFHASCVRMLRRDIEKIGFERNFLIFDTTDQKTVLRECIKETGINEKNFPLRFLQNKISSEKDNLVDADTFLRENESDFRNGKIAKVYSLYQKKLKANNAMDFDDLIFFTIKLLEENEDVLKYYQEKFKYILVDEYQDTNKAQYRLVSLLAKKHNNICVVGDDDQSIYRFRGADLRNILDFEKEYKSCKVIRLEQNYRSTPNIIKAANEVIKNNGGRKDKTMWTDKEEGEMVKFRDCQNEHDEGQFIASEINFRKNNNSNNYNDFAVLYRMNAQSRVIENMLGSEGIPYKIYGGQRFYDRKEIKDLIAYLRLIENDNDDVSLKRIINVPKRGIGRTTIEKIDRISFEKNIRPFHVLQEIDEHPVLKAPSVKLKGFLGLIYKLRAVVGDMTLTKLIEKVINETGMIKELEIENSIEAVSRIENIQEFISSAIEFETTSEEKTLEAFLERLALQTDVDSMDEEEEKVTLMTIHSAKGLEFPVVFLTGMEDGVFPGFRSIMDETELEEERRLCYVGMTRAMNVLYLLKAQSRMLFGNTTYNSVSQFVKEIPKEYVENLSVNTWQSAAPSIKPAGFTNSTASESKSYFNTSTNSSNAYNIGGVTRGFGQTSDVSQNNYEKGQEVEHKKFGVGIIKKIEIDGNDKRLEINFRDYGMKRLMASYARLKIL
jgi:DNA helicase-2/ATP-dependent DNA helicase PcrA